MGGRRKFRKITAASFHSRRVASLSDVGLPLSTVNHHFLSLAIFSGCSYGLNWVTLRESDERHCKVFAAYRTTFQRNNMSLTPYMVTDM